MATFKVPLNLYIIADNDEAALDITLEMMEVSLENNALSKYSIYIDGIEEAEEPTEDDNDD